MSHEIVKAITFKKDGVYLRADSNNVTPKDFRSRRNPHFSEMLEKEGRTAVDIAILALYEELSFQPGNPNQYTEALTRLRALPEYTQYDWRNNSIEYGTPADRERRERRNSEAFKDLLKTALQIK